VSAELEKTQVLKQQKQEEKRLRPGTLKTSQKDGCLAHTGPIELNGNINNKKVKK
jgi:hypothetical protein